MFSPSIRWLLVFVSLGLGVRAVMNGQWFGGLYIGSGLLLIAGHFLYGSVRAAFGSLRRGNFERAHKLLARTPTRWLTQESRAYYHWTEAALCEARGDDAAAIASLTQAVALPLRTTADHVLALCTLAGMHAKLGERSLGLARLDEAHALGPKPHVVELMERIRADLG